MKTAIDFLVERLAENGILHSSDIAKAKEMENQQIIDAHLDGQSLVSCKDEYAEQYYNETFKSE